MSKYESKQLNEIKKWRIKCHNAFDSIWKNDLVSRNHAYSLLAIKMQKTTELCHFGRMHIGDLKKAFKLIKEIKKELKNEQ